MLRGVVLNASALHLGFIGCYGNDEVLTPNLDRLAAEGVVFDQHISHEPKIAQSASLLIPQSWHDGPARVMDLTSRNWDKDVAAQIIAEVKRRHEASLLWLDLPSLAPPWRVSESILAEYFPASADDVEEMAISPWLNPPTGPVDAEETTCLRLQRSYAAVVTEFDAAIGEVLEWFEKQNRLDDFLFCVTADCGLALGEHGYAGEHRAWLHEEIVHIPLIMRLPGAREAGVRVGALTQPADLIATLAESLGLTAPKDGTSLIPLIDGERDSIHPSVSARLRIADSEEWALRTPEWHLTVPICSPPGDPPRTAQLFVKPDDRWEINDIRQHNLDVAEQMEQTLRDSMSVAATR